MKSLLSADNAFESSMHIGGYNSASEICYFSRYQCLDDTDVKEASPQSIVLLLYFPFSKFDHFTTEMIHCVILTLQQPQTRRTHAAVTPG
jgi:hypothetical protein